MLLPVFQDLIKPQWRKVLEAIKWRGGMPVSDLARETATSYMAAKTYCEELVAAGYLLRTRLPRTGVGRPEIYYCLSAKADALFPQAGIEFTVALLDDARRIFGESAADKLLYQYFQHLQQAWAKALEGETDTEQKLAKLAKLREKAGHTCRCEPAKDGGTCLVEIHHPLQALFRHYPRAVTMELRMLEELLGCRLKRSESETGRETEPRVTFEIA